RRNIEIGSGFEFVQCVDDVVACRRRGCRRLAAREGRGYRNAGSKCQQQAEVTQAHQRYPASIVAWVQLRLTPLAVIRQGTDLLVSLVEPWHSLMISSRQAPATVTRAAIRFWIWSNGSR